MNANMVSPLIKPISVILMICASTWLHAQSFKKELPSPMQDHFVQINEHQIMGQEITLAHYFQYLYEIKDDLDPDSLQNLLPARNANNTEHFFKKLYTPYIEDGNNAKELVWDKFALLPITGVNFEQALAYCEFLNSHLATKKHKGKTYHYYFRLPTQSEILAIYNENISLADSSAAEGIRKVFRTDGRNPEGCAVINFDLENQCPSDQQIIEHRSNGLLLPSDLYPNYFGLSHLLGNVSEMTDQKGIAVGGSYSHKFTDCIPSAINSYSKPEDWLGFRIIVDVEVK